VTAPAANPSGPDRPSALAPFRYPAFRAIWIANLFSNLGSLIQSVGAAWLMTELTKSHQLIALVQASTTLPIMLLGLFAGAIADNYDRRRVMLAAQIGMLVVSAVLAVLSWEGLLGPISLLALTFMVGAGTALNGPAWQASVRQQVGPRDLPQAITLNSVAFNLARSVGPALGGLLISLWSVTAAFAFNAVSYIGMIVVLSRWTPEASAPARQPMLASIATGLDYCARSPALRKVLLRGLVLGFGMAGYQSLLPSAARDLLHGDEIDYGLMLGVFGLASVFAAFRVGRLRQKFGSENVVTAGTLLFIAAMSGMAEAHSLALALPSAFLGGVGWIAALTSLNVAMQLRSPETILGRCMAIYQAITFGGMALGAYAWGALADFTDLPMAIHVASGWLALTLLLRFVAPMPTREEGRLDTVETPK
jgi:MFS family permease